MIIKEAVKTVAKAVARATGICVVLTAIILFGINIYNLIF